MKSLSKLEISVFRNMSKWQKFEKWHRVFCWRRRTVLIGNIECSIWLRWILRKGAMICTQDITGIACQWKWEYRLTVKDQKILEAP